MSNFNTKKTKNKNKTLISCLRIFHEKLAWSC